MPCTVTTFNGVRAIVCTSRRPRRRCGCGAWATQLCDWKVAGRATGTCDTPVCKACSTTPAPDKDLCQEHGEAFRAWQGARIGRCTS